MNNNVINTHISREETEPRTQWAASRLLLHVDDDPDMAFLLKRALQTNRLSQWSFLHRSSGFEAVAYLQRARDGEAPLPALLVLDIRMPGMGGLDVLEWVSLNMPDLPAVMLSSSGLLEDRLRARDLGSKGYFEKSATFADFIDFLQGWEKSQLGRADVALTEEILAA